MTSADLKLVNDIKYILNNGTKDENPRPHYSDGTPAHTLFVNHNIRTYNLEKEFPICTLRPIAWKTAIREIFAIYQNQSNKVSEFERLGCNWWKDWMLEDGTIGKSYPYNLESHREKEVVRDIVGIVPLVLDNKKPQQMENIQVCEIIKDPIEKYKKYQLIKQDKNNKKYIMQSLETGEIQEVSRNAWLKIKNNDKNALTKRSPFLFDRNYYGVGYLGNYRNVKNFTQLEIDVLKRKWVAMLKRCYSNDDFYKKYYGNIYVDTRWHSFEKFLEDIRYVPQYFLAKEDDFVNWELDKDYYGSNIYSKDTCVFLSSNDNKLYRNNKIIEVTKPNGSKEYSINLHETCDKYDLNYGNAHMVLNGDRKHVHHYKFKEITNEKYVYRYELSRNQVNELINGIKTNPYGRRHIMDFWNWSNINKKSLVECAFLTIWNVRGEYLDMCLIQRSGDMITASGAGGVNEVQYACLQMMIAKTTGYKPGKLTHFVANEQIYDRHINAANELIKRADSCKLELTSQYDYEFTPVKMNFNPKSDNFYDFSIEDFSIENYSPMKPQLKLDLGI